MLTVRYQTQYEYYVVEPPVSMKTSEFAATLQGYPLFAKDLINCVAVVIHNGEKRNGVLAHIDPAGWNNPRALANLIECLGTPVDPSQLDVVLAGGGRGKGAAMGAALQETNIPADRVHKYCMGLPPHPVSQPHWVLYQPKLETAIVSAAMYGVNLVPFELYAGNIERRNMNGVFPGATQVIADVLMPQAKCLISTA